VGPPGRPPGTGLPMAEGRRSWLRAACNITDIPEPAPQAAALPSEHMISQLSNRRVRRNGVGLASLALAAATSLVAQEVAVTPVDAYPPVYEALVSLEPDAGAVATVAEPIELLRPGLELTLASGRIALLRVDGRVVGAAFAGEGSATVTPTHPFEEAELARLMGDSPYTTELRAAAFVFTDGSEAELRETLDFGTGEVPSSAGDVVEHATRFLRGPDDGTYDPTVMRSVLNRLEDGLFHAHLRPTDGDALFYRFDPRSAEEVSFGREGRGDAYEVVTRFHLRDHYDDGSWRDERTEYLADLEAHEIELHVEDEGLGASFVAAASIRPAVAGGPWIAAGLMEDLRIDSLRWDDGSAAAHDRPDDSSLLWIRLPADAAPGRPRTLHLYYAGDVARWQDGFYGLTSSTGWYLHYGHPKATFDLTFFTDPGLSVVAGGEQLLEETRGDTMVTHWVVEEPRIHTSFSVGPFREEPIDDPRGPPITVQVQERGHQILMDAGFFPRGNPVFQIGVDIVGSMAFYRQRYGALETADAFHVAEIPYGHGQAFPGLIHLSFLTYLQTNDEGNDESFRAHEVAHQWWGLGVRGATERDTWLEEGLSEFPSLWYLAKGKIEPDRVLELLDEDREEIMRVKDEAGPIWLGRRHLQLAADGGPHYQSMIYTKGAWVFHMLRMMLMDLQTRDDAVFANVMRTLFQEHQGGELHTVELQEHVETMTGLDLQWFFDQWVYGTAIPTVRFSYTGRPLDDGTYQVVGRAVQEDVPDDWQMFVPVLFDFGENGFARARVRVEGPETVLRFPPLPYEPERVVFNDLEGVLAEIETEGWSGPPPWGDEEGPGEPDPER